MTSIPTNIIKRQGTYALTDDGRLFAQFGTPDMYLAGHVSNPENLAVAIDVHEEEIRVLVAEAKAEFN